VRIEAGFSAEALQVLESSAPRTHPWPDKNLFFGGVHAVSVTPAGQFHGAGDPRRGGEVAFARSR